MSATSATGAAGTPAPVSRSCQEAVSSCAKYGSRSAISASRFATRSGFVRKRGSIGEVVRAELAAEKREQAIVPGRHHQLAVPVRITS